MRIAACLKWTDLRPEVDPVTGAVRADARSSRLSDPDRAALEWALRCAEAWDGEVVAVTAGPPAAASVVREALAAGAGRAVRVDMDPTAPTELVAAAVAVVLHDVDVVWCGDASVDRGSGAFPAFLAARLAAAQALGLLDVTVEAGAVVNGLRRVDGGRRERLRVWAPSVCSVEGATAMLRRASLASTLAAGKAAVDVVTGPATSHGPPRATRPYRPRPRMVAAPRGESAHDRIASLLHGAVVTPTGQAVVLEPDAAAERILEALVAWGELGAPVRTGDGAATVAGHDHAG
jgi:electron transfer flavoprotein beta subunit